MTPTAAAVIRELKQKSAPERAEASAWFFKTKEGQYGYGDVFFGITVPEQRAIAKKYVSLPLAGLEELLKHKVHECRLTALLILVEQYRKAAPAEQKRIVRFYVKNRSRINNWDLVDLSAPRILGSYLASAPRSERRLLHALAKSKNLWDRRIAILSCFAFIPKNDFNDALKLAKSLLGDTHDLMHKAVGWMLREIGKRSLEAETKFLDRFAGRMPRTMLRYAIERFPEPMRLAYLDKKGK